MSPEGRTDTKLFGPDAWKHIAVCVVCDGRVRGGTGKVGLAVWLRLCGRCSMLLLLHPLRPARAHT